jgi:hypothetical protein
VNRIEHLPNTILDEPDGWILFWYFTVLSLKGKAIPVTGRRSPHSFETPMLPNFLNNRLTDGSEVVSLTCRLPFTPKKDSCY